MRERSRQAQRIAAARPEIVAGRRLLNLDADDDAARFRGTYLAFHTDQDNRRTFDPAWLADRRRQWAAWQAFGPMRDWSGSAIPGISRLSAIRVTTEQTLADFLISVRSLTPAAKWLRTAAALASGPQGASIRDAIPAFLGGLNVSGTVEARARLWAEVGEYRNFRRRVLDDARALTGLPNGAEAMHPAVAAALIAFFDCYAPFELRDGRSDFSTGILSRRRCRRSPPRWSAAPYGCWPAGVTPKRSRPS
jgi:hypothetical protein